jgi:hypothetical protein
MVRLRSWIQVVLVVALPAVGCFPLATENPGEPPLDAAEATGVLKCQHVIKAKTQKFVNTKLLGLQTCADRVLETLVRWENGLISEAEAEAQMADTQRKCRFILGDIKRESTRMIDGIVEACEPVSKLVLSEEGGDPLGLVALGAGGESVEEMAGVLCGIEELLVDLLMAIHVPRVNDQAFAQVAGFEDTEDLLFSVLDGTLDERCFFNGQIPLPIRELLP